MDVAMFLYDQYIMSIDALGFHERFLPMVTAVFLMLLHTAIEKCPAVCGAPCRALLISLILVFLKIRTTYIVAPHVLQIRLMCFVYFCRNLRFVFVYCVVIKDATCSQSMVCLVCLPQDQPLGSVLKQEGIKLKVSQFQYEVRVH